MRLMTVLLVSALASCMAEPDTAIESQPTTIAAPAISTTTSAGPDLQITDCATPQITFAPMCETFDLIQTWHVDRPIDSEELARAALIGLQDFETDQRETAPRTVICAIPDPAFEQLCSVLAERVVSESIPIGPAIEQAVIAMTDEGLDPFSYYLTPDQAKSFRPNGVVGGIGVLLDANDAAGSRCARITEICRLTVVFVLPENPAAEAGLMTGDVILAIDGLDVNDLGFVEAGGLIAGDETGAVSLDVEREGRSIEMTIDRARVSVPTVEVAFSDTGIGYMRVPDFEADIPGLVHEGLLGLEERSYSTLVLDLRDNPGGLIDSVVPVTSEFLGKGPILIQTDIPEPTPIDAIPGGVALDKRLIVLVNRGTASAAEVMAAALRDRGDAVIIGEPTFGKDAIQIVFDLDNGAELHLAVARWLSPDGNSVQGGGLVPDSFVELPPTMTVEELVASALELGS